MSNPYLAYLQELLQTNNIQYLSESSFYEKQLVSLEILQQNIQTNANQEDQSIQSINKEQSIQHTLSQLSNKLKTNLKQELSGTLVQRYSRQMLLKQITYQGQLKINKAKLALIGSGGIGCPLAMYLAGAGIGTLGLFDSDTVDVTNLHRQIAHKNCSVGIKKTQSLKKSILQFNPNIQIITHQFVTVQTMNQLQQYDFIIDGSDNPQCRYIVNDYCMKNNKKLLSGACIGWEGQVTCYGGGSAPCYRCIWGNEQKTTGGCSALGVIGMLPGIVGLLLATQALKMIINGKSSLQGNLLTFECRQMTFRKVKLRPALKDCIGCGNNKLNMFQYDYSKHSLCSPNLAPLPKVQQISWQQYLKLDTNKPLLDVRPSNHFNICHLQNMVNLPYEKLSTMNPQDLNIWVKQNLIKQDKQQQGQIFISCNRGITSKRACQILNKSGFKAVSVIGGITQFSKTINPNVPIL